MLTVNNVPQTSIFKFFSLDLNQMHFVAVLAGGNVRVGLEDNLTLDRSVPATSEVHVTRAVEIIERLGATVIGPQAVRDRLGLTKRANI